MIDCLERILKRQVWRTNSLFSSSKKTFLQTKIIRISKNFKKRLLLVKKTIKISLHGTLLVKKFFSKFIKNLTLMRSPDEPRNFLRSYFETGFEKLRS